MPLREPISFSPFAVTAITTSSGQSALASSGSAKLSLPSAAVPACISTKPPKIERAAEPDPCRATMLRSRGDNVSPNAASPARTSAANPDADDASPAPVGKLLRLATRARVSTAALRRSKIETGGDLREILVAARPVQRELVARETGRELDRRLREQRVERDRDRADGRHVQARIGLAPIFDEREIGAGARSRDAAAFLLRSSHSP